MLQAEKKKKKKKAKPQETEVAYSQNDFVYNLSVPLAVGVTVDSTQSSPGRRTDWDEVTVFPEPPDTL